MPAEIRKISRFGDDKKRLLRREKFIDLAEKRTVNAIKAIRTIAKLGNKSHYEFDERDVKKIVSALNKEIEALKMKMLNTGGQDIIDFKL